MLPEPAEHVTPVFAAAAADPAVTLTPESPLPGRLRSIQARLAARWPTLSRTSSGRHFRRQWRCPN